MKKIIPLLTFLLLTSGCSAAELRGNFFTATKETTEAVNNLTKEAQETKALIESKVHQAKNAAESVSQAAEALDKASQDIKTLTGSEE